MTEVFSMNTNKNRENLNGGVQDVLITIIGVLVYIAYKLAKGTVEFIKNFMKSGILTVIGAIIMIVLAIMFWPLTLAITATMFIWILCCFCL